MHPPGPTISLGRCVYCPNQAELVMRKLPCGRQREEMCSLCFVRQAKRHTKCRPCFGEPRND